MEMNNTGVIQKQLFLDKKKFRMQNNAQLGGIIFIHGRIWTLAF